MPPDPAALPLSPSAATSQLAALRGLRSAPDLEPAQRQSLRQELQQAMQACQWFTVGVMAPDQEQAVACLRSLERSQQWSPLQPQQEGLAEQGDGLGDGPVFLKGNQRSGSFLLRREDGLGEGLLITGHNPDNPGCEDTWGPLPLDLFAA